MKGKYVVTASSKRVEYKFMLTRKYTMVRGDSGTGKTTLYNMLVDSEHGEPSISFYADVPCVSADYLGGRWDLVLPTVHNSIIFIDEGSTWVRSKEFADIAKYSDNYFVIFGRHRLSTLPYSVNEIYEIKTSGKFHRFAPVYKTQDFKFTPDYVLTEDSNSGFQFFNYYLKNCGKAGGKSNIFKILQNHSYSGKNCLVFADGAAFGSEIERIVQLRDYTKGNVRLYLPESFEQLLLRLSMFSSLRSVKAVLADPASYVSTEFNSWEQFFTDFLHELTLGTPLTYSKSKLPSCFLTQCCNKITPCQFRSKTDKAEELLSLNPKIDFSKLRK